MARKPSSVLTKLTTQELKRLLAARERIDVLEKEKARILKELSGIERELAKLVRGAAPVRRKKTTRKKRAKKTARKKVVKKTVRRKVVKKTTRKKAAKASTRKGAAAPRMKLEDVIVKVLGRRKKGMSFKDLHATIVDGKLFATKSAKFDNVLRRTLSTSKKVKRVGRGVYAVA